MERASYFIVLFIISLGKESYCCHRKLHLSVARIKKEGEPHSHCTGFLYDSRTLITSASCIGNEDNKDITVVLKLNEQIINYKAVDWRKHPQYDENKIGYNLMVMRLNDSIPECVKRDIQNPDNISFMIKYLAGSHSVIYGGNLSKGIFNKCGKLPVGSFCATFTGSKALLGSSPGDLILDRKYNVVGIYDREFNTTYYKNVIVFTSLYVFQEWIDEISSELQPQRPTTSLTTELGQQSPTSAITESTLLTCSKDSEDNNTEQNEFTDNNATSSIIQEFTTQITAATSTIYIPSHSPHDINTEEPIEGTKADVTSEATPETTEVFN